MNDVRSLLSDTVPPDLRTPHRWEDTEADLARGRTLLARRRRRLALAGGTGLVAAGAAGTLLLTGPANRPAPVASPAPGKIGVALVAYAGAQPKGYTLRTIPKGWEVASADNTNLVLHKIGTPKTGTFDDKILIEGDLNPFPATGDKAVRVNGAKGWFFGHRGGGYSVTLIFQTDQRGVVHAEHEKVTPLNVMVQLPQSLDWDVTTMVRFASGITVANGAGGAVG